MSGGSRALPGRPSLRYLKLEAKRRLAAGEFVTLNDAQTAIAREYGRPSWADLKQACEQESHALDQLRWIVARFSRADQPGWTAPGEDELREHFDDRLLAMVPPGELAEGIATLAPDLRAELVVIVRAPLHAQVQLAGLRYFATADPAPPHRLTGLRGFVLGDRVADPRVKAPPPPRVLGEPPEQIAAIAAEACAELGLPALLLAGGDPGVDGPGDPVRRPAGHRPAEQRRLRRSGPAGRRRHRAALRRRGRPPGARPARDARLGTGWASLLPPALARQALAPQTPPGPGRLRVGLGWLLPPDSATAIHSGNGAESVAFLRSRLSDLRTYVVLTSRVITVELLDDRLRRSWLGT